MKHKDIHWPTATDAMKKDYLYKLLQMELDPMFHSRGLKIALSYQFSDEEFTKMSFKDVLRVLKDVIQRKRTTMLFYLDDMLSSIAELDSME